MDSGSEVVTPGAWRARSEAHRARLEPYVGPHLRRRRRGERHPVHDFLFDYYSHRPAQLTTWVPGWGGVLAGWDAGDPLPRHHVRTTRGFEVAPDLPARRRVLVETLDRLLRATAARPPHLGCFGLHEWAMVYRTDPGDPRHAAWPLRLGHDGTDEVVESHRLTCTHFDAYRFFTPDAAPLNATRPRSDDRAEFEQPGCLHQAMDLYKHASRLWPLVSSDLVADCFELAWDVRVLDMRAAPYDLSGLRLDPDGQEWTPVPIETPAGRQEYARAQREVALRAAPLRERLIAATCTLREHLGGGVRA